MARTQRRKRLRRASPARRVGKIFYRILVGISALIVVLFCAYQLIAKEPEMAAEPTPTPAAPGASAEPETGRQRKPYTYTFLLVAKDQVGSNADTMMVCMYDTVEQTVGLVSIPRDTLVESGKLNAVYQQGVEALRDTISDLLGIPIDFYVAVDMEGFKVLVDELDGIDFNVPVHMAYDDPAQDLHIHYEPGMQHLDGQDVLNVARCRKNSDGEGTYPNNLYSAYPDNDIGRTRTQQQLIAAIVKKALSNPQKLNSYIEIFLEYVNTNLEFGEMLWFAQPALGFDFENGMTSATLTGDGNTYYPGWGQYCYQLYPEETLETVNQLINPYDQDLTLEDMNIFQYQ